METTAGITAEVIELTPAIAKAFLLANKFNRTVNQRNVARLSDAIRRGEWKLNNDAISFSKDGSLINGQHRCHAVIATDLSIPVMVIHGLDESAFLTMDQGGKPRQGADALSMIGVPYFYVTATALHLLHCWVNGWVSNGSAHSNFSPAMTMKMYREHPGIDNSVQVAISVKHLVPQSLGAFAHYVLSRVDEENADRFFMLLSTGANLSQNHPILSLRNKLFENKTSKAKLNKFVVIGMIFRAWNFFVSGKSAKFYRPSSLRNITVKGDALWNSANNRGRA